MDLHTHLDLYPNAVDLLPIVSKKNSFTLSVTTSPRAWIATSRVFESYENIKVALGLHPEIAEQKKSERALLLSNISKSKYIGEVGIDGSSRFRNTLPLQRSILEDVISECEHQGGRIISIHTRGAVNEVLDLLEKYPNAGNQILHWFTGSLNQLRRATDLGCWFSVGPAMLRSATGIKTLKSIPLKKLLPESDGPFAQIDSKPVLPWEALNIADPLSKLTNKSTVECRTIMDQNLNTLLKQHQQTEGA